MNTEIQPRYYLAKVTCACGNEFAVGSTQQEIKLDICSNCHPFFTGKQKFVDTAGRVDKYFRKYGEEPEKQVKKKKKRRIIRNEADIQALLAEDDTVLDEVAAEVARTHVDDTPKADN